MSLFKKRIFMSIFAMIILPVMMVSLGYCGDTNSLVESRMMSAEGSKLFYAGKIDDAIVAFKKAIEIRPQDATANFSLALCYRELGDTQKAIDLLEAYLQYVENENPELSFTDETEYIPQIRGLLNELKAEN